MTAKQRQWWLGIALLVTLALTAYVATFEEAPVADTRQRSKNAVSSAQSKQSPTKLIVTHSSGYFERKMSEPKQDIFLHQKKEEVVSQAPKQPAKPEAIKPVVIAPPVVMPPAPPSVPALPFKYIGKYADQAGLVVFLGYNGKNLMIKAGDVIQQTYRVDSINPPLLTMTYLPMDIRQVMNIGELN